MEGLISAVLYTLLYTLIAGILFLILRLILRGIYRLLARPTINISYTIGEAPTGTKEFSFFPTKQVSLWIESKTDIDMSSITFRRICRYQRHCLLFRFFFRLGVLRDRAWCSFANVNDWILEGNYGFIEPTEAEKETINDAVIDIGELTLRPSVSTLRKGTSTQVDVPFRLSCERPHTVVVTVSSKVNLRHRGLALRALKGILDTIRITDINLFRVTKSINLDWAKGTDKKTQKESNDCERGNFEADKTYIGTSYRGIMQTDKAKELTLSLKNCIDQFISKTSTPSEIKVEDAIKELRREIPHAKIVLSASPQGSYRVLPIDTVKELLSCWITCRDFCNEFLNCTNYAALFKYFGTYFIFFPYLLANTFRFLCIKGHSTRVDLLHWFAYREGRGLPALIRLVFAQLKFLRDSRSTCRLLQRRNNKQAEIVIKLANAERIDSKLADELLQSLAF